MFFSTLWAILFHRMASWSQNYSFAWYSATTAATMKTNTANGTVSVTDPSYEASAIDLPLKVVVTRTDGSDDLELAHWYAEAADATSSHGAITAGLNAAYWNDNQTYLTYKTSPEADHVLYATYEVKVQIDEGVVGTGGSWNDHKYTDKNGGVWTKAELAAELQGDNISVTLARADGSSYAMFFSLGNSNVAAAAAGSATPSAYNGTLPATIPSDGTASAAFAKFGLYVDGEGRTNNIDSSAVSGNFTVTVAAR